MNTNDENSAAGDSNAEVAKRGGRITEGLVMFLSVTTTSSRLLLHSRDRGENPASDEQDYKEGVNDRVRRSPTFSTTRTPWLINKQDGRQP